MSGIIIYLSCDFDIMFPNSSHDGSFIYQDEKLLQFSL